MGEMIETVLDSGGVATNYPDDPRRFKFFQFIKKKHTAYTPPRVKEARLRVLA